MAKVVVYNDAGDLIAEKEYPAISDVEALADAANYLNAEYGKRVENPPDVSERVREDDEAAGDEGP